MNLTVSVCKMFHSQSAGGRQKKKQQGEAEEEQGRTGLPSGACVTVTGDFSSTRVVSLPPSSCNRPAIRRFSVLCVPVYC